MIWFGPMNICFPYTSIQGQFCQVPFYSSYHVMFDWPCLCHYIVVAPYISLVPLEVSLGHVQTILTSVGGATPILSLRSRTNFKSNSSYAFAWHSIVEYIHSSMPTICMIQHHKPNRHSIEFTFQLVWHLLMSWRMTYA